jgi:hypothetical protein
MKKLLLIALLAGGFMFVGAPHSDAQVYFSIGFGFPGYYGYYPYGYYAPYRYYYIGHTTGATAIVITGIIPITITGTE